VPFSESGSTYWSNACVPYSATPATPTGPAGRLNSCELVAVRVRDRVRLVSLSTESCVIDWNWATVSGVYSRLGGA